MQWYIDPLTFNDVNTLRYVDQTTYHIAIREQC